MVCNEYIVLKKGDNERTVKGTVYADSFPSTLPTNGADIDGLSESDTLGIGMTLFTPNGIKMLFPGGWEDI